MRASTDTGQKRSAFRPGRARCTARCNHCRTSVCANARGRSNTSLSRGWEIAKMHWLPFCDGRSRERVPCCRRRADVLLPPQGEVQQGPASFLEKRQESLKLKNVCALAKILHLFAKVFAEFGVIPLVDGNAKALLLAVDQFVRNDAADGLLQDVFKHSVSGFYSLRNAHSQFHELVIKKRNARFQTDGHAHFVDAHEQQFRQSEIQVEVGHPVKRRFLPGFVPETLVNGPESFPGTKTGKFLAQSRRKEALLLAVAKHFGPAPEDRPVREGSPESFAAKLITIGGSASGPLRHTECGKAQASQRLWKWEQVGIALQAQRIPPVFVAPEQFVRALADLANDDAVVASKFGNVIYGHANRIRQRFVLVVNDERERVEQVAFAKQEFMVVGAYGARNLARVGEFARIALVFLVIANRKGLDRPALAFRKKRGVGAGVDAAGEKDSYGHVADLPEFDGSAELRKQAFGDFLFADTGQRLRVIPNVPVARFADLAVGTDS